MAFPPFSLDRKVYLTVFLYILRKESHEMMVLKPIEVPFSYELWESYRQYKLIQLVGPVGVQDRCYSALHINQNNPNQQKALKAHHHFNCSFRIIAGVSDVQMERDHSWIVFLMSG